MCWHSLLHDSLILKLPKSLVFTSFIYAHNKGRKKRPLNEKKTKREPRTTYCLAFTKAGERNLLNFSWFDGENLGFTASGNFLSYLASLTQSVSPLTVHQDSQKRRPFFFHFSRLPLLPGNWSQGELALYCCGNAKSFGNRVLTLLFPHDTLIHFILFFLHLNFAICHVLYSIFFSISEFTTCYILYIHFTILILFDIFQGMWSIIARATFRLLEELQESRDYDRVELGLVEFAGSIEKSERVTSVRLLDINSKSFISRYPARNSTEPCLSCAFHKAEDVSMGSRLIYTLLLLILFLDDEWLKNTLVYLYKVFRLGYSTV